MAPATQALRYGWLALASLGIITGVTIYKSGNTRKHIKPEDIIELVLGVHERCLATQYDTNGGRFYGFVYPRIGFSDPAITISNIPSYRVYPPYSFRRVVTNSSLSADFPLSGTSGEVDSNGVVSLRARAICYTTYWPNASALIISYTNLFPSSYTQYVDAYYSTINYADSWTASNGYHWTNKVVGTTWPMITIKVSDIYGIITNTIGWHVDRQMMSELDARIKLLVPYYVDTNTVYDGSSNISMLTVTGLWATLGIGDGTNKFTSTPAIGMNAATYGALPWQIYEDDLVERYKVLNVLEKRFFVPDNCDIETYYGEAPSLTAGWTNSQNIALANYQNTNSGYSAYRQRSSVTYANSDAFPGSGSITYNRLYYYTQGWGFAGDYFYSIMYSVGFVFGVGVNTNLSASCDIYIINNQDTRMDYDDNGMGIADINGYRKLETFSGTNGLIKSTTTWGHAGLLNLVDNPPVWCDNPGTNITGRGVDFDAMAIVDYQFNYCTNKFW